MRNAIIIALLCVSSVGYAAGLEVGRVRQTVQAECPVVLITVDQANQELMELGMYPDVQFSLSIGGKVLVTLNGTTTLYGMNTILRLMERIQ